MVRRFFFLTPSFPLRSKFPSARRAVLAIVLHLPFCLLAGLTQSGQEPPSVLIVFNHVLSMITSVHQMMNGAGILTTKLTWHDRRLPKAGIHDRQFLV